jgi:hypothetical protein
LYYLSGIYAGQLEAGEDYEKLKPVIGIHFPDYEMFPDNKDFRFRFEMRDVRHPGLRLTDDMTVHISELPKSESGCKDFIRIEGSKNPYIFQKSFNPDSFSTMHMRRIKP